MTGGAVRICPAVPDKRTCGYSEIAGFTPILIFLMRRTIT